MSLSSATSINNMNIVTFIRDIYQSLKNLETRYQNLENKVDQLQELVNDKLIVNEHKLNQLVECVSSLNSQIENSKQKSMNNELEKQLLQQMELLNKDVSQLSPPKLDLKLSEMTIANLVENNYTTEDIFKNIKNEDFNNKMDNNNDINGLKDLDIVQNNPKLMNVENLLF
jgi:hypothetical protein